jgi:hypothetical protein
MTHDLKSGAPFLPDSAQLQRNSLVCHEYAAQLLFPPGNNWTGISHSSPAVISSLHVDAVSGCTLNVWISGDEANLTPMTGSQSVSQLAPTCKPNSHCPRDKKPSFRVLFTPWKCDALGNEKKKRNVGPKVWVCWGRCYSVDPGSKERV